MRRQNQSWSEAGLVGARRAELRLCHRLWPFCQVGNHTGTPALLLLAPVNEAADLPVEPNQLGIDGQHRPRLSLPHALTDLAQQGRVVGRQGR